MGRKKRRKVYIVTYESELIPNKAARHKTKQKLRQGEEDIPPVYRTGKLWTD